MNIIEIFLSKLYNDELLYNEIALKLGFKLKSEDFNEELLIKLDSINESTEIKLYISDENIINKTIDKIVLIFNKASENNINVNITAINDEFLNLIDSDDRITSMSKPRSLIHRDGDLHATVHIWLISRKDMGIYVILQKRSAQKLLHPECFDVSAAGHVIQGDEFRQSAVREVEEELGISVVPQKLECIGTIKNSIKSGELIDNELSAVYIYRENIDIESLNIDSTEVSEVCWAEIDEILSVINRKNFRHCISVKELEMIKKAVFR